MRPFPARYGEKLTRELRWLGRRRRAWARLGKALDACLASCSLPALAALRVDCANRVDILTAQMLVKAHLRRAALIRTAAIVARQQSEVQC